MNLILGISETSSIAHLLESRDEPRPLCGGETGPWEQVEEKQFLDVDQVLGICTSCKAAFQAAG